MSPNGLRALRYAMLIGLAWWIMFFNAPLATLVVSLVALVILTIVLLAWDPLLSYFQGDRQ